MITILGVQFPVTNTVLTPARSEVVLDYVKAMNAGKGQAKKVLSFLE